jgi:non-canonical purine NTP pyrophosphatase (RdgB/HAM1 family)
MSTSLSASTESISNRQSSLLFVTSNAGKIATARQHLNPLGIDVEHVQLELDEIQSDSVEVVALHKARQAFELLKRPLIIEDSGFYIDELGDFPGPFVKFVIKSLGADGIARLADLTATRRCHFIGVLVYVDSTGEYYTFAGTDDRGTVANSPSIRGEAGSWSALWDVFVPDNYSSPLSSLSEGDRSALHADWAKRSVFTRFGTWLSSNTPAGHEF